MADISDVEQTIVNTVLGLVYPTGIANPSLVLNDAGQAMPVRIYRGWPLSAALDADLAAGIMNISVFTGGKGEKNTTRFHPDYQTVSIETPTVTASVNALNQIVIAGAGAVGIYQYVTVLIGSRVVVSYSVQATDTTATIATAVAALISSAYGPAAAVGGVITVTFGSPYMIAKVGVTASQAAEWRRQIAMTQITFWAPTPISRDNAAKLLEPQFAKMTFLTMPDQFQARFRYEHTLQSDASEKIGLYRRDLTYHVEYATTDLDTAWQVTSVNDNIEGSQANLGQAPNNFNYVPTVQPPVNIGWPGPPFVPVVPGPP